MRRRHFLLGIALTGAVWLVLFGPDAREAAGEVSEPATRRSLVMPVERTPARALAATSRAVPIEYLHDRAALIGGARAADAQALFIAPAPPPAPVAQKSIPVAPPLPFVYYGKWREQDGDWEIFLVRGEQLMSIRAPAEIDERYRVTSIRPPHMTFIYLPLMQTQILDIGRAD